MGIIDPAKAYLEDFDSSRGETKLVHPLDDKWEEFAIDMYSENYFDMKEVFEDLIRRGFERTGTYGSERDIDYLSKVLIENIKFLGAEEDVFKMLKTKKYIFYHVGNRARVLEASGEAVLWFDGVYKKRHFVNQGQRQFLNAASLLEQFHESETERSLLDKDLGNCFGIFLYVLQAGNILEGYKKLNINSN